MYTANKNKKLTLSSLHGVAEIGNATGTQARGLGSRLEPRLPPDAPKRRSSAVLNWRLHSTSNEHVR